MHPLNWVIVVGWLTYVVSHGLRRSRGTTGIDGYFLANRSLPWWAVGLSVMATQLSAVTMIGTTGQGASDGMQDFDTHILNLARAGIVDSETALAHASNPAYLRQALEQR